MGSLLLQDEWRRKCSQEGMVDRWEKGAAFPTQELLILRG